MLQFKGSIVALVTPMQKNGDLDEQALNDLVKWHIKNNTQAIVIAGTTGESATLSLSEYKRMLKIALEASAGKIPIIAGSGTNNTQTSIEKSIIAEKLQVDALLVVTPYYNKPPQSGLIEHYRMIAAAVSCPIILYNVPSRTGCDLLPASVAELSKIDNIIAIKEATASMERLQELQSLCAKDFIYLSGDDASFVDFMQHGGHGVISVTANVAPKLMQEICEKSLANDFAGAIKLNEQIQPLHRELMVESNPIPVKWALQKMGKISSGIRLPLRPLVAEKQAELNKILQQLTAAKM